VHLWHVRFVNQSIQSVVVQHAPSFIVDCLLVFRHRFSVKGFTQLEEQVAWMHDVWTVSTNLQVED